MAASLNRAVPEDAPIAMEAQKLDAKPVKAWRVRFSLRTFIARIIAFLGALAIGTYGSYQMRLAFGHSQHQGLQYVLLFLFSITFYWISFSTTSGLAGLLPLRRPKLKKQDENSRIALVMPVYGEDPAMTGGSLLAMAKALEKTTLLNRAEIFIISDTQDADAWVRETAEYQILKQQSPIPVWYRRRHANIGRKAGNVEEFVRRFGGRYQYMVMLDADSLLSASILEKMVKRMDSDDHLGLLQSMPRLVGGESFLARAIQFADALYGPVVARGVDAWQGEDGNYWGHNALIRIEAFAGCCGLPVLQGRRPIGGHIMSHDFVEAALMRRAGWVVRMDPDLKGSYEGLPPTLEDLTSRERRWAQGNLQHLGVLGAKGLRWPSRVHFIIGIGSYLMSPIWMLMLIVGMMITAQTLFTQPQYFPLAHQLFPEWPTFDSERMIWLFCCAMGLLFLPKVVGALITLILPRQRRKFGGAWALICGFILELIISTLYAPVMMLTQTRQVIDIFLGRDSGWKTQERTSSLLPWHTAIWHNIIYVFAGVIPLAALIWLAPMQIVWLSPIIFGLILSPILDRHSGNVPLGRWLREKKLLLTPEEYHEPKILSDAEQYQALFHEAKHLRLQDILQSPQALAAHCATLDSMPHATSEAERLVRITATAKIQAARSQAEALSFLDKKERLFLATSPDLLQELAQKREH